MLTWCYFVFHFLMWCMLALYFKHVIWKAILDQAYIQPFSLCCLVNIISLGVQDSPARFLLFFFFFLSSFIIGSIIRIKPYIYLSPLGVFSTMLWCIWALGFCISNMLYGKLYLIKLTQPFSLCCLVYIISLEVQALPVRFLLSFFFFPLFPFFIHFGSIIRIKHYIYLALRCL